jgi:hypothetical protein
MLHYLVPASSPNDMFCAVVASGLINRYPIPYVIGWKGEGKYNATAAHFAKLYTIKRYLDDLPNGGEDDDLIVFGDGHDVVAQLPVEVIIERYFEVAADADRRLADRFGISVEEAHERGLRQTLFWGADKMCWPPLYEEAQCSKIPGSHLPQNVFGPKSGNKDYTYREAKFLNSGSVIGPVGDLRKFVDAGIAEMETTFDDEFKYKNSDQVYLSRIFGRQEISRTEQVKAAVKDDAADLETAKAPNKAQKADGTGEQAEVDDVDESEEPSGTGAAGEKRATFVKSGKHSTDVVEYHLAIDYESAFVQTGCYSHKWMHKLQYNNSDNSATMKQDIIMHGENFKPYKIQMPANVYKAFRRVFDSLGDDQPTTSARAWISSLELDTNVITKTIFGFYHATCSKKVLIRDFKTYWFHPLIEPLMRAAVRTIQADEPITEKLIDGRKWVYKKTYPSSEQAEEELGGVFTDYGQEGFITYKELCGGHMGIFEP